jgi:hypothetical protein
MLDTEGIEILYHDIRCYVPKQEAKFEIDGYEIGNA